MNSSVDCARLGPIGGVEYDLPKESSSVGSWDLSTWREETLVCSITSHVKCAESLKTN